MRSRPLPESGKVFGLDRIAVMTALNLAHELLEKRHAVDSVREEADVMVKKLTERITEALAEHKQLGF